MTIQVPIIKKATKQNEVLIERPLPVKGDINVAIGEKVEPFTKLGIAKVSHGVLPLKKGFKVVRGKPVGTYRPSLGGGLWSCACR